jgi:hypothetical protein
MSTISKSMGLTFFMGSIEMVRNNDTNLVKHISTGKMITMVMMIANIVDTIDALDSL